MTAAGWVVCAVCAIGFVATVRRICRSTYTGSLERFEWTVIAAAIWACFALAGVLIDLAPL